MKIEIVVATHKRFDKPELDGYYSIFKTTPSMNLLMNIEETI